VGSRCRTGSVHDLTASELELPTLSDGGDEGASIDVHTPQQPAGDQDNRTYNALLRGLRSLGRRGFALLTGRRCTSATSPPAPRKTGDIVKAALVLTHFKHCRLTEVGEIISIFSVSAVHSDSIGQKRPDLWLWSTLASTWKPSGRSSRSTGFIGWRRSEGVRRVQPVHIARSCY
jgi:hypothetical protein